MHFHADHSLFFERRQPVWRAGLSLGVTLLVLAVNAGANSAAISVGGSLIGALLLMKAYVGGHRRVEPALAWTIALVVCVLLGSAALQVDFQVFAEVAARVLCGVIWVLWLGSQMDWACLREILLNCRVPESIVSTLDHALMHGVLTQREWTCRRNSARLRSGKARLALTAWARLLGEGALQAFMRLERVEENALIRCSSIAYSGEKAPLQMSNVSVKRGGHLVLNELNLQVSSGEWVLVCGPSGAGKSSLLRLIAGLDAPDAGEMTRLGTSVSADAKLNARLDGRVALLVQNPEHHFIASTVAEDIAWGLLRRGVDADEAKRRSTEMAASLRIEHLLGRPCHELSFGEQRRVALAGLLVLRPALLLLDEPTAGLDPVAAHELRTLVQEVVKQTGAACLWATHDLDSRPAQARRTILLREGRVIFDGPTDEGLTQAWLVRAGLALEERV